ncbi:MAG TPA: hypothetical protein VFO10_12885 [Oligoflexus sp.]|uniref:hypothetical protein n=1 Tax=Oligoflexus sp. TaxID=1971216 RepID=UPI002D7E34EC|nr:hypothetical protein [Oligoflexus sp.]HET9238147.1 hypothetical protein [Oligoflexus sp.]
MNSDLNRAACLRIVQEIEADYQQAPGLILTENDLQCILHSRLSQAFTRGRTVEGYRASPVHGEVSWYDQDERLAIKPDISIFETENLQLFDRPGMKLPSKGFAGRGSAIMFELKFFRFVKGPSKSQLAGVWKDLEKIQGLFQRLHRQGPTGMVHCFFVVFSKSSIGEEQISQTFHDFSRTSTNAFRDNVTFRACTGNAEIHTQQRRRHGEGA